MSKPLAPLACHSTSHQKARTSRHRLLGEPQASRLNQPDILFQSLQARLGVPLFLCLQGPLELPASKPEANVISSRWKLLNPCHDNYPFDETASEFLLSPGDKQRCKGNAIPRCHQFATNPLMAKKKGLGPFDLSPYLQRVPEVGLEPTRPCGHWILNPARLPIPPLRFGY